MGKPELSEKKERMVVQSDHVAQIGAVSELEAAVQSSQHEHTIAIR